MLIGYDPTGTLVVGFGMSHEDRESYFQASTLLSILDSCWKIIEGNTSAVNLSA
jgi:hypothetical protein